MFGTKVASIWCTASCICWEVPLTSDQHRRHCDSPLLSRGCHSPVCGFLLFTRRPSSCDMYTCAFTYSTESTRTMELHNSLLPGWHTNTWWIHMYMHTQAHLHLQMQALVHRKNTHAHTHFTSVFLLFRTAAALRMSWRVPVLAVALNIDFLAKNIRISLFVQGYAQGKGCGSFSFMLCLHTAFSCILDEYKSWPSIIKSTTHKWINYLLLISL